KFMYSGVGQGWTLTMEETFYALAPLIFFFIARNVSRLFILLPISFALGVGQFLLGRMGIGNPHLPHDLYSWGQLSFFLMFFPLAIGILCALVYLDRFPRL